ncbi:uncharacterized protein [Panulirus ornatus]|uniref:uncharacterized protein n=1 Tax=Panulirus ornatus TaxID=150431 RepID=UPI003A843988
MNFLLCEVCLGQYGERGRWPRVLQCGHTLCSLCVVHVLKRGAAMCPFCFSKYPANTPSEVPLNYIVLKILSSPLAVQNPGPMYGIKQWVPNTTSGGDQWSSAGAAVSISASGTTAGYCRKHGPHRQFWCVTCQVSLCRDCTLSHHPAASCKVIPCAATQAVETIKKVEDESVKKSILQFDQYLSRLHNQEEKVKNVIKRHTDHVRQLREMITRHHRLRRKLETELRTMQAAISDGLEACVELIEAQTDLFEAKTVQQVMTARQRTRVGQTTIENWYNPSLGQDSEYLKESVRLQITTAECLLLLSKREIDPKFVPSRNSLSHLLTSSMEDDVAGRSPTAEVDDEAGEVTGAATEVDDEAGEVTGAAAEVDHEVDQVDGRNVEIDHVVPKINRRVVRMLYRYPVLVEEPDRADGKGADFNVTADKVDCGVASVDGSAAGVDDRAADVDDRTAGVDDMTAGVDDRAAGVDGKAAVV